MAKTDNDLNELKKVFKFGFVANFQQILKNTKSIFFITFIKEGNRFREWLQLAHKNVVLILFRAEESRPPSQYFFIELFGVEIYYFVHHLVFGFLDLKC